MPSAILHVILWNTISLLIFQPTGEPSQQIILGIELSFAHLPFITKELFLKTCSTSLGKVLINMSPLNTSWVLSWLGVTNFVNEEFKPDYSWIVAVSAFSNSCHYTLLKNLALEVYLELCLEFEHSKSQHIKNEENYRIVNFHMLSHLAVWLPTIKKSSVIVIVSQLCGRRTAGPADKNVIVYFLHFPINTPSSNFLSFFMFLAWKCLYARSYPLHFKVGIQLFSPTLVTLSY